MLQSFIYAQLCFETFKHKLHVAIPIIVQTKSFKNMYMVKDKGGYNWRGHLLD